MAEIDQLVAMLREEEKRSYDPVLSDERAVALDFYNGMLYGDEEEGRSQVVTRDVAEVVDYMTVSILRTMISGDRVVEFECSDKAVSEQATLAVSRTFFQGQRGYQFLHDWIKAGLLEKCSVAKAMVEPQPPKRMQADLSVDEFTALQEQAQVIAAEPLDDMGETFRVAWLEPQPVKFCNYVVPNEQASFAQDATDLDDNCIYVGFHHWRTLSQLAEMGFDTEGLGDNANIAPENLVLLNARDEELQRNRLIYNRTGANRRVIHHEEYIRYDLNGDGISELLLVHRVNNTILTRKDTGEYAIEEIDEQPGVAWCPFPMQHRIVGQSLADKVMDIQRTSSVLMRQALDNLYQTNSPRWTVAESSMTEDTISDLLTNRPGGLIRHTGATPPVPVSLPFAAASAFDALEVLRGDKESRTGITRMNQGLDADALNKTATGTALQMASGQQIEEYIARNFAEAFARLMLKTYRLMRQFGSPFEMPVDGEVTMIDPRQWPEDMQVMVRVGLGTGRKDQRMAYRTQLLQIAQAALAGGSKCFDDEKLYNNLKGWIADASLGSVRELLNDPTQAPEDPPKPDPMMAKVQADAAIAQQKIAMEKERADAENAIAARQQELQAANDQARLEYDLQAAREKAALEAELARERAALDDELARTRMAHEFQIEMIRLEQERALAERKMQSAELPENRPGGALDA